MKRIWIPILGLMLLTLGTYTGCRAQGPAVTAEPAITATAATPTDTPTAATPTPQEQPPADLESLSHTTGLPFEGVYRPVLVVIENSPAARPQKGMQAADVVYEVPVEGSITRFVCVYSDTVPEEVMPVRSARIPFVYIQSEWDAVFMHFGGAGSGEGERNAPYSFYGHPLFEQIRFDVDGLYGKWNDYYYRAAGVAAPHNVVGRVQLAQQLYDYDPQPLQWLFAGDVAYPGEDVRQIELALASGKQNFVSYTYDEQRDVYLRSMAGKPFISAETGEQVSVKNIIVQYSSYTVSEERKLWQQVGRGDADFYIGAKHIRGSWEKQTQTSQTVFYDANGDQIVLRPGNTWIHISTEQG